MESRPDGDGGSGSSASRGTLGGAELARARPAHRAQRSAASIAPHQRLPESIAVSLSEHHRHGLPCASILEPVAVSGFRTFYSSGDCFAIKLERSLYKRFARVEPEISLSPGAPKLATLGGVLKQHTDCRCECWNVARLCKQTGDAFLDHFCHSAGAASDNGLAEHHRFEKYEAERFVARRRHEDVALPEVRLQLRVRNFACEVHTIEKRGIDVLRAKPSAQSRSVRQRPILTDQNKTREAILFAKRRNGREQNIGSLSALEPAGVQDCYKLSALGGTRLGVEFRVPGPVFHPVRDDRDAFLVQPQIVKSIHRFDHCAAVRSHAVSSGRDKPFGLCNLFVRLPFGGSHVRLPVEVRLDNFFQWSVKARHEAKLARQNRRESFDIPYRRLDDVDRMHYVEPLQLTVHSC